MTNDRESGDSAKSNSDEGGQAPGPSFTLPPFVSELGKQAAKVPVLDEVVDVCLHPLSFFGKLPAKVDLSKPIVFLGATSAVAALGAGLKTILEGHADQALPALGHVIGMWCLVPFVAAGIIMLLGRALGGSGSYTSTLRAVIYAQAPIVVSFIPVINFVGLLYSLFLLVSAVKCVQGLKPQQAMAIVVILGAGLFVLFIVSFFSTFGNLMGRPAQ